MPCRLAGALLCVCAWPRLARNPAGIMALFPRLLGLGLGGGRLGWVSSCFPAGPGA